MAEKLHVLGVGDAKSINFLRWAWRVKERGHRVTIVSNRFSTHPGELDGLVLHDIRRLSLRARIPVLRHPAIPAGIGRLARDLDVDLVHAHYLLPYGWWTAEAGTHPFVASPWGTDILIDSRTEPGRSRAKAALDAADAVVLNSAANRAATTALGFPDDKIRKIIWYAEPQRFSPEHRNPAVLEELGFPPDSLLILSLRNFRPDTNLDVVVRAFARVHAEEPRARLLLAARGGPTRDAIEELIDSLALREAIKIQVVAHADLPRVVGSSDVLVSMAISDSTPASLLEAMASGLPVVCGAAPSIEEWVPDGEGGTIVPAGDEAALTAALLALLRDPELRQRYGERNRRTMLEEVGDPGARLEELYLEVLGR